MSLIHGSGLVTWRIRGHIPAALADAGFTYPEIDTDPYSVVSVKNQDLIVWFGHFNNSISLGRQFFMKNGSSSSG
jgi:hypothetical protein